MSASVDHINASIDVLQAQMEREARRNGKMEFAVELAAWAAEHREELPSHLIEQLAQLIMRAGR